MNIEMGRLWIERICLLYLLTWAISPPLQFGTIYRILCIFCYILIEFLALSRNKKILNRQLSKFLFIIFLVVMTYLVDGRSAVNVRLQLVIFLMLLSLYDIYKDNLYNISFLLWWCIILCIIWNICTLNAYLEIRNISRMMAKNFEGASYYAERGIGGYAYIYSMVFMLPMVIRLVLKKKILKNVGEKVLCITYIFTTALLLLKAGYTIAILITGIGLAGIIITNVKIKMRGVLIILVYIIGIGLILNLDTIFIYLIKITNETMYYQKVLDIINSLKSADIMGNVYARYERYSRSISLFIDSPILGQLSRSEIGKHSQILDMFAQFGIFVGVWFCSLFYIFFKSQKEKCPREIMFIGVICFIVILYSCLNNLTYANGAILGICFPLILEKLGGKSG